MTRNIQSVFRALQAFLVTLMMGGAAVAQSVDEQRAWEHAQAIGTIHEYQTFLDRYPNSTFAKDATDKIVALTAASRPAPSSNSYHKPRLGSGNSGSNAGGGTSGY